MRVKWYGRQVVEAVRKATGRSEEATARLIATDARASGLFHDRTGALRRSIRVADSRFKDGGKLVMAGGRGPWGDAWYAPKVELGWKGASARPFMRTAKERARGRMRRIFLTNFGRGARLSG